MLQYVLLALVCLLIILSIIILVIISKNYNKKSKDNYEETLSSFNDRLKEIKDKIIENTNANENNVKQIYNHINSIIEINNNSIKNQSDITKNFLESLKADIEKRLDEMNINNEKKLDEMQKTVNEKLAESLEGRIQLAFKNMNDRLDSVQQNFVEVQKLSNEVVKLNGVFTNVKNRGVFGEVTLDGILSEILTSEQYYKQYSIRNNREAVDFAIRLPANGEEEIYLPIDSKFPLADYERLTEAYDKYDAENINNARRNLLNAVKRQAKSICEKYIEVPYTTDFAIMFLPTEGLFSEVAREAGFIESLRREYKIIPCGPTTISALLNSLMVGFTTLKIQKKSSEIVSMMKGFGKDFGKLIELIARIKKNSEAINGTLEEIDKRNAIIQKGLLKLETQTELFSDNGDNEILKEEIY